MQWRAKFVRQICGRRVCYRFVDSRSTCTLRHGLVQPGKGFLRSAPDDDFDADVYNASGNKDLCDKHFNLPQIVMRETWWVIFHVSLVMFHAF